MSLTEVPCVRAPSNRTFAHDHLLGQRPVVIRNLYAGQPISRVTTAETARAHLGRMPIRLNKNYYHARSWRLDRFECRFSDYCDLVEREPSTRLQVTEQLAPRALTKLFALSPYADINRFEDPRCFFFAANRGMFAPLHFDGDHRHVLLTQVVGRKRVVLIPPARAKHLFPILNFSAVDLHAYGEKERRRFLNYLDASIAVLHPGDTLFIPKLWWHYVEYVDFGVSFNLRFGRTPHGRVLAALPIHHYLQNLSGEIVDEGTATLRHPKAFERMLISYFSPAVTPYARYRRLLAVYEDLYGSLCPDAPQGSYIGGFFDFSNRLARPRIRRDCDPFALSGEVPRARINRQQRRLLGDTHWRPLARQLGWPSDTLVHLNELQAAALTLVLVGTRP